MNDLLLRLAVPFEPKHLTWKPGVTKADKCMALAYADLRAYMERLDEVVGTDWGCAYEPWGDNRIIARLTIAGVIRSSTGEMDSTDEKGGNGGTVAEAQAFKRACTMFGLGRFLYELPSVWVDFDPQRKRITESGQAMLKARYEAWYAKTRAASAAKRPLPVESPARAVDTSTGEIIDAGVPSPAVPQASGPDHGEDNSGSPDDGDSDGEMLFAPTDRQYDSTPHTRLFGQLSKGFGPDADDVRPWIIAKWTKLVTPSTVRSSAIDLSASEKDQLADYIKENLTVLQRAWRSHRAAPIQSTTAQPKSAARAAAAVNGKVPA